MEQKKVFPCGENDEQKIIEKSLKDESSSEVSGGVPPHFGQWMCCGMQWGRNEKCGICGKSRRDL